MTEILKIRGLSTGYAGRVVSRNLTANLQTGKVICLIGANGAGKSTLLRTMAGYMKPLAGRMEGAAPEQIGVVLTEKIDAMGLNVQEVVSMGRHPHTGYFGILSSVDVRIVEDALKDVGILDFASRKFSALSDGEKQKVMIAKALAQQTPVILMDEPSAFLDFPSKVGLMKMLQELAHTKGKAILLSTHDVGLALKMADVLWLLDGESMKVGSPAMLTDSGDMDAFLGESRFYL